MSTTERRSLGRSAGQNGPVSLLFVFLFLTTVVAQSGPPANPDPYPYARFSPSMAVIISVLIAALFFMGFFSIYICHCSGTSSAGSVGRAISLRARRAAAARGLDQSVLETFPTFSYSEVKDHKIGKGALECAVCLNEFEDNETLRLLPKCDHVFHPECIDAWLESHVTCPVCRANLDPQTGDEPDPATVEHPEIVSNSVNEETVIQVDDNLQQQPGQTGRVSRNTSFQNPNRPQRSWSMKPPSIFGFGKFRSHSTGHSVVPPGENLERFTLRLPEGVRKEVMNRAMLNRARSFATVLPTESSSRKGYRNGGEGSSRAGRVYERIELPGRDSKSDRWSFFTRGLSFRSPRMKAETGEGSTSKSGGGSRTPVKMPSFKCLSPKADAGEETRPISGQSPV